MHYASIILPINRMDALDYLVPDEMRLEAGEFVLVPFRGKEKIGIVTKIKQETKIDPSKLKPIIKKIDLPKIKTEFLEFIKRSAKYNMGSSGSFIKMALPIDSAFNEKFVDKDDVVHDKFDIDLPNLSEEQTQCLSNIDINNYNVSLIDGITGSGKTEVYFASIAKILEESNGQVLIMLPEIMLTTQLISRFKERFGFEPAKWHSGMTTKEKRNVWLGIIKNKIRLVIGARSALFLPFPNLKIIVIDEEHDASYKQEEGTIYHARDMAVLRGYLENFSLILASATPSIETMLNARVGKYNYTKLESRFTGVSLPEVEIVDMRQSTEKSEFISKPLRKSLLETFAAGEQSMLFLNRRGYAPLTLCGTCGHRFMCHTCSSWLVEHKSKKRLECHHCGYVRAIPKTCPECKSEDKMIACGPGVERIEEELKKFMPEARIQLITKDSVKTEEDSDKLVNKILAKEVDVIIGTQMVAKGHHFPALTLVGVIDADIGLTGGDLRACERTFQLLQQVSGRAGRDQIRGKVFLQTYYPDNELIKSIAMQNRDEFIDKEIASRDRGGMPPFSRLVALIISDKMEERSASVAKNIVKAAPLTKNIQVLGPVAAVLSKLRGKYRYRVLIKADKSIDIQKYVKTTLASIKPPSSTMVKVDVDPYNFL